MSADCRLLAITLAVPTLSAATAALVCWPIRSGPLAPRILIFGLILATGVIAGLPACFSRLSATESDRPPLDSRPVLGPRAIRAGAPATQNLPPRKPTCCTRCPRS
ncbi:hypothetical protein ACFVVX_37165 [Kitasatospora sp. NPDC058170]|uniref:hypothetical protein n=1 Tax=Kitasatospora sp. NPDC058170 TaxID=3346364 RepID=UPI0036DBE3B0